jgi:hypothetical protein
MNKAQLKDFVTIDGDEITIYGKRYAGEIFRCFDLGTDERTYLQILSKKDDECVVIRLDLNNFEQILVDLKARATQAIQEFDDDEAAALQILNNDVAALWLALGLKLQNDNN